MNKSLLQDIETLAGKAAAAEMGYEAKNFAEAALALAQASTSLHYAENPPAAPLTPMALQAGGTDD